MDPPPKKKKKRSPEAVHVINTEHLQFGKYDRKNKFVKNSVDLFWKLQKRTLSMDRVYT